ncbi:MAG TPA: hypothetical protein VFK41_09020 [Nocardioidaceae bacterium]|nr:hypothetical protein [Nocardioidaceae bacterium]
MAPPDIGSVLHTVLDPVLTGAGFSAGQGGWEQMIFCAVHDELSDRYPVLPQSNAQDRGQGCCIDLMIEVDRGRNRFIRLDLENHSVVDTLRACGHDAEAAALHDALGADLEIALPTLADSLRVLFQ